jgi:hypothetical protein
MKFQPKQRRETNQRNRTVVMMQQLKNVQSKRIVDEQILRINFSFQKRNGLTAQRAIDNDGVLDLIQMPRVQMPAVFLFEIRTERGQW